MNNMKIILTAFLLLFAVNSMLYPNDTAAAGEKKSEETKADIDPSTVIVKVNGKAIVEGNIEDAIKQQLASRPEVMENKDLYARYKQSLRRRVLNNLINSALLSQAAEKENLTLTDKDIDQKLQEIVQLGMKQTGMTREELAADILKKQGMTIEESLNKYKTNKQFLDTILFEKIVSSKFSDKTSVSDQEIKDYYDKNLDARYKQKATVTASHILVTTVDDKRQPLSEEKKKEAKEKIEKIQKEVNAPGADFGALAEKYSDCPSGKRSKGSLGAFPRTGAMVEPFAKAAFELKPGEISDIVETRFGYHLIKVTDKSEEKVTPLDEVKDDIAGQLARTNKSQALSEYVKQLRDEADIVYLNKDDDPEEIEKKKEELINRSKEKDIK